jgi:hypothetical protein
LPDILLQFVPTDKNKANFLLPFATMLDFAVESPDGNGVFWQSDGGVLTKLGSGTVSF